MWRLRHGTTSLQAEGPHKPRTRVRAAVELTVVKYTGTCSVLDSPALLPVLKCLAGVCMLQEFIELNREEIIQRCRAKVATRSLPPVTEAEINFGVPLFLDQLVDALRSGTTSTSTQIGRSAGQHGHDLLLQGLSVS